MRDIRYALRQFRQSPAFTLTAVVTLALGIGGTTAIFSLIHSIMLRSLPVKDPAALVRIGSSNDCCVNGGLRDDWGMFNFPFYRDRLKQTTPQFEEITAFQSITHQVGGRRTTERIGRPMRSEYVEGNYFRVFGIRPFAGRLLTPADDRPAAQPALVMSFHFWQSKLGGDASVVGSVLMLDGHPYTVAGIAPPGFFGETLRNEIPDVWLPLHQEPVMQGTSSILDQSDSSWLRVVGRLKPGATTDGVEAHLTAVLRQWLLHDSNWPAELKFDIQRFIGKQFIHLAPAGTGVMEMKEEYGRTLSILMTVCGLVLLIACANIANLLLARGMARRRTLALQMALGSSRARLMQQAFTESVVLALLGGALGLLVSEGAGALALRLAFGSNASVPLESDITWPMMSFAVTVSVVTGIIFGTAPAWFATHTHPSEALRSGSRTTGDRSTIPQRILLVLQATLSVVLVAGAAMLTRSLGNLEHQNFGYSLDHRIAISLSGTPVYEAAKIDHLQRQLLERLQSIPGVTRAGIALYTPFTDNWSDPMFIDRHLHSQGDSNGEASWNRVSPGFFDAIGQKLLKGRLLTDSDRNGSAPVAVVNETFAKRFLPGENPIGQHFGIDFPSEARRYQIVGVINDSKYYQANEPVRPMYFVAPEQHVHYAQPAILLGEERSHVLRTAILETALPPGRLEPMVRRAVAEVDPSMTVLQMRTLSEQVSLEFNQQRAIARLAALFGVIALVLAAVGLYGVTSYSVAQRTSEIGLRMALGAGRPGVMQLVIGGAFRQVLLGLAVGIPISIAGGKLMGAKLYGIGIFDPPALSISIVALSAAAFVAASIPALRASSIDPILALKTD